MRLEKGIMKTETIFSEDGQERFLLRKEWNKNQKACVLMTNPSTADLHKLDYTTMYIINNLADLGFGSVDIVNMVSKVTMKLDTKSDIASLVTEENIKQIIASANKADKVIIAWGKLGENNKKIRSVQEGLLEHLRPFQDKLYIIGDSRGAMGFHPLAPSIRFSWDLVKLDIGKAGEGKEEVGEVKNGESEPFVASGEENEMRE